MATSVNLSPQPNLPEHRPAEIRAWGHLTPHLWSQSLGKAALVCSAQRCSLGETGSQKINSDNARRSSKETASSCSAAGCTRLTGCVLKPRWREVFPSQQMVVAWVKPCHGACAAKSLRVYSKLTKPDINIRELND